MQETTPKILLKFFQFIYGFSWAVPVFYFYLSGATEVGDRVHRCTKERKKGKTKSRVPARSIPSSSPTATAKIRNLMLSARRNGDDPSSTARTVERLALHLPDDILGALVRNLAENDVLTIKMRSLDKSDEELGAYNNN